MAQYTQQFLSSVLSQRGPAALPYAEDVKWLIRQHLVSLAEAYPSLQPKTATFTHNDGRTVNLLQADGTVPMLFQGVTYNIPVAIWLMESYPRHAPLVFVNPTRDMIIKRPHPFVSPNGVVSIPYIQNWVYPSSNILELARNLCHFFGRDPPLYSQRKFSNPNSSPNYANNNLSSVNSSVGSAVARPAIPPRVYSPSPTPTPTPPPPYGTGNAYGSGRIMEDPAEVFKKNAINKLVESLNGDIRELRKTREAELEGLFSAQAVLRKREEELGKGLKEMQDEKEGLEQQLQVVLMNSDVLEGWLRENEEKMGNNEINSLDVDETLEPCDALSKQMLDCTACDLVVEDVIYALDKAVQEGAIPFDQYLRNVRLLSREQFFHRATASKVRAVQMQAQIINHGANEVLPKMKAAVAAFFELPSREKNKYAMAANDVQGYGQGYVVSDEQKLDWNDLLFLMTIPSSFRNMKYWPNTIPGFKEALEEYSVELQRVIDDILSNLSLLMGMERGFLKELHGVMKLGMRMNYYPTCSRPDLVLGVSPHSDCSSITLLLQDDDITAFQIKHKEAWIPVKPVPNALVVNIGDVVEAWSNGLYKSIEHRAVTNEKKPRISVATFVIPGEDVELNPLETMVDGKYRPRIYKNDVKYVDYLRYTLARKMDGKATNLQYLKLQAFVNSVSH